MVKCNRIRARDKEERMGRAIAQLKVSELSSELISELEIPCARDEEVEKRLYHYRRPTGRIYLTLYLFIYLFKFIVLMQP
jgi:hypothetical protein